MGLERKKKKEGREKLAARAKGGAGFYLFLSLSAEIGMMSSCFEGINTEKIY